MNVQLKPCPFCGKLPKVYEQSEYWHIGCIDCDIIMCRQDKFDVFEKWNTRKRKKREKETNQEADVTA